MAHTRRRNYRPHNDEQASPRYGMRGNAPAVKGKARNPKISRKKLGGKA